MNKRLGTGLSLLIAISLLLVAAVPAFAFGGPDNGPKEKVEIFLCITNPRTEQRQTVSFWVWEFFVPFIKQWAAAHPYVSWGACAHPPLPVRIPMMWLLTGPNVERMEERVGYAGNACMLISETHPSVERQNAKCFPINDPDWTATNAPCAGPVYDDGTDHGLWACDAAMEEFNPVLQRLPLYSADGNDLWHVYQQWLIDSQ